MAEAENSWERAKRIADWLRQRAPAQPQAAVVLGSGLSDLGDSLTEKLVIPYAEIPEFPTSTVPGHKGNLIFGSAGACRVVLMQGRFHAYEGYSPQLVSLPARVFRLLGCRCLLLTNAAGGLADRMSVGDVMLLRSHLNLPALCGLSPLRGSNDDAFGPRFPSTSDLYDAELRQQMLAAFTEAQFPGKVHLGTYAYQVGPAFETVAEVRMLAAMGADAVGMSTAPEALTAHHCGLRVVAFSLITNLCQREFDAEAKANHEEVLATGASRAEALGRCVATFLRRLQLP